MSSSGKSITSNQIGTTSSGKGVSNPSSGSRVMKKASTEESVVALLPQPSSGLSGVALLPPTGPDRGRSRKVPIFPLSPRAASRVAELGEFCRLVNRWECSDGNSSQCSTESQKLRRASIMKLKAERRRAQAEQDTLENELERLIEEDEKSRRARSSSASSEARFFGDGRIPGTRCDRPGRPQGCWERAGFAARANSTS